MFMTVVAITDIQPQQEVFIAYNATAGHGKEWDFACSCGLDTEEERYHLMQSQVLECTSQFSLDVVKSYTRSQQFAMVSCACEGVYICGGDLAVTPRFLQKIPELWKDNYTDYVKNYALFLAARIASQRR